MLQAALVLELPGPGLERVLPMRTHPRHGVTRKLLEALGGLVLWLGGFFRDPSGGGQIAGSERKASVGLIFLVFLSALAAVVYAGQR